MRVLLDTNIIIDREGQRPVPIEIQSFLRHSQEVGWEIFVHPRSREELMRDSDVSRRESQISKIASYPSLSEPPDPNSDIEFMKFVGTAESPNESVDNSLLFAVKANAVDFLVTNDQGLHRKAKRCGIETRVLTSDDAATIVRAERIDYSLTSPPSIVKKPVHNLNPDDPILDELKSDYPDFSEWWNKISRKGRDAWVYYRSDGSLGAILILKIEEETLECDKVFPKAKRLKICTLVVTHIGFKLGELFIKLAVEFCLKNHIDEIFLTHFTKEKDYLVSLIADYGFVKVCEKHNYGRPEDVFLKKLTFSGHMSYRKEAWGIAKKYYPSFYCGRLVSKFLVPIRPEYHERLFLGFKDQQTIPEILGELEIPGNTIDKAYLSNSTTRQIKRGDLLLFYRSQDLQKITTISVVEDVHYGIMNSQKAARLLGNRTVLSRREIDEITHTASLLIRFRFLHHFPDPIAVSTLIENNLIRCVPQQIMSIDEETFGYIIRECGVDSRYLVN
jgi:rRNA-processing protein FCF1